MHQSKKEKSDEIQILEADELSPFPFTLVFVPFLIRYQTILRSPDKEKRLQSLLFYIQQVSFSSSGIYTSMYYNTCLYILLFTNRMLFIREEYVL